MLRRRKQEEKSIEISFARQTNPPTKHQDHQLKLQILRVQSIQKQRMVQRVWQLSQGQLCDFFSNYSLFPQNYLTMSMLLESNKLNLIKSEGKIYFGEVNRGQKHGWGVQVQKAGQVYEGEFSNNFKRGRGIQIYSNCNLYAGEFLNNKKHGQGQFYWFNITRYPKDNQHSQYYAGQWWGGLPDGQGLHHKASGDLYTGTFKNGLKHGQGEEKYGNRDYYKGQFTNGLPEGYGDYLWADGSSYKGDFKQGQRSGYGVWRVAVDRLEGYQGHYNADKKSGYGMYTWDNQWTYKGYFENDYRNGLGELFNAHGKLSYEGEWFNGDQIGQHQRRYNKRLQLQEESNPQSEVDEVNHIKSTLVSRKRSTPSISSNQRNQSAKSLRHNNNFYNKRPEEYATISKFAQQNLCQRPERFNHSAHSLQSKSIRIRHGQVGTKITRPLAPGPAAIVSRNKNTRKM